jgi:hypothetical protein
MRLYVTKVRVGGKVYENFKASLTKREAYLLSKLGKQFVIEDVDEKTGSVWLKACDKTTIGFKDLRDPVSSFRLWVDVGLWERFKVLCRERGLSVCRVLSDFVRAVCFAPDLVESPGGVKVVNVFLGRPRSRLERKLWETRLRMVGGHVEGE